MKLNWSKQMEIKPHLVAGNPEDVAKALIAGKPASGELRALYARCLREEFGLTRTDTILPTSKDD